jgi:hypothetical protein
VVFLKQCHDQLLSHPRTHGMVFLLDKLKKQPCDPQLLIRVFPFKDIKHGR